MKLVRLPELPRASCVSLPVSKSLSHRVILATRLAGHDPSTLTGLSESEDSRYLLRAVMADDEVNIHIGEGAAPFRFFLAYRAARNLPCRITGSSALMSRPILPLLYALEDAGAGLILEDQSVLLTRGMQRFGRIRLESNVSSQFASALMLVAPLFHGEKTIEFEGSPASLPYLEMTAAVMQSFGIETLIHRQGIGIRPGQYRMPETLPLEADWSAAAFFYSLALSLPETTIQIPGLKEHSLQGDRVAASFYQKLGVYTTFNPDGAEIAARIPANTQIIHEFDLRNHPDLAPALIAACAFTGAKARFSGIGNLMHKESDRLQAMNSNLNTFGVRINRISDDAAEIDASGIRFPETAEIQTYHDHRIAMAMAIFALKTELTYDDPACVAKSFPGFWEQWSHWFTAVG